MRYTTILLTCFVLACGCGPRCLYWWDKTGKNRGDAAAMIDYKVCYKVDTSRLPTVEFQEAEDRAQDCMRKRGWIMSDRVCPPNER